ncbi:MAG: adenine phosphoribosyltransferase [Flavobacteriales bacterium CG_4_10_14_0_2_um_filter_32_8]|nr:MAG: adenine phosphoribosyltransferase [Flavobacteriales bacterium CG_4_10_14_0_2_um_filter_32_8]PJB14272.1 MAG: adenine phosphoribosyltransferase [Flavobacteriales bacterium CG_4_9_14_3_um_filter_32_8]
MISTKLAKVIRDVPDFPSPGILFKDITPIFLDAKLCTEIVNELAKKVEKLNLDAIVGIESRGFFFGIMLANKLNLPFIPIRKKGKLPYKTVSYSYDLEYGSAEIEMHQEVIQKNWNVLIHDDLLATGGTAAAAAELILKQDATVAGFSFVVELTFLDGVKKLSKYSKNMANLVAF